VSPALVSLSYLRLEDKHGILWYLAKLIPCRSAISRASSPRSAPDCHGANVGVRTVARTARRERLCRALGGRPGLCHGLLLLAALSPRLGASLGGLPPAFGLLGQSLLGAFC